MSKLWLVFLAGPNSYADLQEMVEPIRDLFAGLVVTYHGSPDDLEAKYLETVKGKGRIIYLPYSGRHDHSRNTYLWCGPIQQGDWCLQTDVLEHPNRQFIEKHVIPWYGLTGMQPNCWFYYGKPFVFQYHESLRYVGTPHESFQREDGQMKGVELNQMFPNEADVRLNVRPKKRPVDHFVKHYGRYALLPWGSNHYILPLSGKPNADVLFRERETARLAFIDLLRELHIKRDVDAIIEYMRGEMDPRFKAHVERDKIWNDVYRRYVLDRHDFVDDHDWNNRVPVGLARNSLDNPSQVT